MNTYAINLTHVTKQYVIHHEKPTLIEKIVKSKNETFCALRDINITIKKGERVGVIGPNGSGKTTLLKVIAGITAPTQGIVHTYRKVISLIDLEAGFHPDLTGYQNIFLNGMLLGMKKKEIEKKLLSVVKFADIHQFIDAPMFTYSSGMALRLGFAVAVHANPDILLLDEGLSVGDRDFQKKSQEKIRDFFQKEKTVVVVTHNLDFIAKTCQRVLQFQNGSLIHDGGLEVLSRYKKS